MLDIKNLQRKIDGVTIIKAITAQVKAGDVVALLGKNGAGKTTLLETLLGFAFPSYGLVTLWTENATDIDEKIKDKIGFVPQQNELLLGTTVQAHLNLFKSFRKNWDQALVDRLVIDWLIPLDATVGKLSLGQQQKLSILLALAHKPELLVLDEPVASLDPIARRQFIQQLIEVASDSGNAIIFSSHIVSDMERIANQVWMLNNGELIYQGGLDELKESVVRVTFSSHENIPHSFGYPNIISQRINGKHATIIFNHWNPEVKLQIEKSFNSVVQVEYLSLEDIFLEMNA
ncbi:MAG: ABC transporter ATP-binding protein [Cellvibrio sp.]